MKHPLLRCALVLGLVACAAAPATAQSALRKMLKEEFGDLKPEAAYTTTGAFKTDVRRQSTRMAKIDHQFDFSLPLAQDERQELSLGGTVGATDLDTRARLPDTGERMSDELWDLGLWTAYRRKLDNGWIAGGSLALGSPSDKPFASGDEVEVSANGFVRIPQGESDAWVLMLNWSNNRDFARNIPLPGVAYELNRGRDLQALLGVPFSSVRWRADERLTLTASYMIPRTVHAKASYALTDKLKAFVAYDWQNSRWFRHDRPDDDDRLFFYEMKATTGIEWEITRQASVVLAAGYGFERLWFEGEDYDDRNDNRIDVGSGPLLSLSVMLTF